jgi:hypothetical protein
MAVTLVLLVGEVLMLWKRKRNIARRANPEIARAKRNLTLHSRGSNEKTS